MVFSITQNPYSYSINPLLSFVACSFSALKISRLFARQVHLLNLSKEQAQKAKKIFLVVAQLSTAISVVYPNGSTIAFFTLYIVSIAASRYFQTLTSSVAHIGEKEDPLVRFKMLDDLAKSKPMLNFVAQTEKAKIINDHPEISTLSYFESFDEMIQFARTYEVSKLNLSGTTVSSDQMEILTSQLLNLAYLNLANCKEINDLSFKKITSRLTQLTDLNIDHHTTLTFDALKTIASLKHLTHLNISHCENIKSSDIQALMTALTNLTYLDVSGCDVDDTSLQAISTHLKKLTHLDINLCVNLESVGIQSLRTLTNLSWLSLSNCKVDDTSLQIIATHLKKLTHLDLGFCSGITSNGILSLTALSNLSWLDLSDCDGVNDTSLQTIATHLKKLTHLDLRHCSEMTSAGIQSLRTLSNLSWLNLFNCPGVDDPGLQTILSHLTNLTYLDIGFCISVTDTGMKALASRSDLTHLILVGCEGVTDTSLQTIATHLKKLIHLDISCCSEMTSAGIQSLRTLSNLSQLDLSYCPRVDDSSLQIIASHLKKLSYLTIDACPFSITALEYFASFEKIKIFHTLR